MGLRPTTSLVTLVPMSAFFLIGVELPRLLMISTHRSAHVALTDGNVQATYIALGVKTDKRV